MKNIKIKSLFLLMGAALGAGVFTACDEDKQLTLNATEGKMLESIEFECSDVLKLGVGMDSTLVYSYGPEDVTDATVVFKSDNESVATVDQDGTIHAHAVGTATISALPAMGFKVYDAEALLTVDVIPQVIKAQQVNIVCDTPPSEEGFYYETDLIQLHAEILPADHTYDRILWSSSNPEIATVDKNGLVTALKEGDVVIRALAEDHSNTLGTLDFHFYKLVEAERTTIKPLDGPVCISYGTFALEVEYFPKGATIGAVKWESDDESICKVERGRVTPVGFGTCNISAICPSTGDRQTVQVTVETGWYIWDARNKWGNWDCANTTQADTDKGDKVWRVFFPDPAGGNWRRDIKMYNATKDTPWVQYIEYPVIAMRCTVQKGGRNTFDGTDGNPQDNSGYDLPDGSRLIMLDNTGRFQNTWKSTIHEYTLFQIKVADIPNANVDPAKPYYDIYWIRTFKSTDEAKAFATAEAQAGN